MKIVISPDPRELENSAAPCHLKVLLVYDDISSGLRAKAALDRLTERLPTEGVCRLDPWKLNLLDYPQLQHDAAQAAARADIVLLSFHGDRPLPSAVKIWLELWMKKQNKSHQALGVLFDVDHRTAPETMETTLHLYRAAQQARAKMFLGFSGVGHLPKLRIQASMPGWPVAGFPLPIEAVRRLDRIKQVPCYG